MHLIKTIIYISNNRLAHLSRIINANPSKYREHIKSYRVIREPNLMPINTLLNHKILKIKLINRS